MPEKNEMKITPVIQSLLKSKMYKNILSHCLPIVVKKDSPLIFREHMENDILV